MKVKSIRPASSSSHSLSDTSTSRRHDEHVNSVHSHAVQSQSKTSQTLLTTCRVLVTITHAVTTQAKVLLDSASSTSFISEQLAQSLNLSRSRWAVQVTGISGMSNQSRTQFYTCFQVSSTWSSDSRWSANCWCTQLMLDRCGLTSVDSNWLILPNLLLSADIFSSVLRNGRWMRIPLGGNCLVQSMVVIRCLFIMSLYVIPQSSRLTTCSWGFGN